jgi:hypothetical protein
MGEVQLPEVIADASSTGGAPRAPNLQRAKALRHVSGGPDAVS